MSAALVLVSFFVQVSRPTPQKIGPDLFSCMIYVFWGDKVQEKVGWLGFERGFGQTEAETETSYFADESFKHGNGWAWVIHLSGLTS